MSLVYKDRVKETTSTTGTGTLTLAGASAQHQSFAAVGDANTCDYCILGGNGTDWETGTGTYTASGTTLSRDTIRASSNGGSAVSLTGTSTVFLTVPAAREAGTTFIQTLDASASATLDFTGLTGTAWELIGTLLVPATNSVKLMLRFGTGVGPTWSSSGYDAELGLTSSNSFSAAVGAEGGASIDLSTTQVPNSQPGVCLRVVVLTDNANWVRATGTSGNKNTDGHWYHSHAGGGQTIGGQLTGIRLLFSSGNITSGKATLYRRRQ
jgi:hypothetical protein